MLYNVMLLNRSAVADNLVWEACEHLQYRLYLYISAIRRNKKPNHFRKSGVSTFQGLKPYIYSGNATYS